MIIYDFVDKEKDMELNSKIKADPIKKTACKKSTHMEYFWAALAALYLTLVSQSLSDWVSHRHLRISTQIVTF